MPETAAPPTPAPAPAPAPTPAPTPTPAGEAPAGIAAAMKDLEQAFAPKPAPKPDAKPAGDKPEGIKPAAEKPAPVEPKPEDMWEKAPGKLKGEHFKMRRQFEDQIADFKRKLEQADSAPKGKPSADDLKLIEKYKQDLKDLNQKLAARDFRESQEFKKQFTDRINADYRDAIEEVKSLRIYTGEELDGTKTSRSATKDDFDRLFSLPTGDQDAAIMAFGPSAHRVAGILHSLTSIVRASERAVHEHAQNSEVTAQEKQAQSEQEAQQYEKFYNTSVDELKKHWPQYFAPDDQDPEGSTALEGGYKYIDQALEKVKTGGLSVEDRAAYNAVIRARAAGFTRAILDNNRLKAERDSLKEELKKFRKSDPGEAPDTGAADKPSGDEIPSGIAQAVQLFKG